MITNNQESIEEHFDKLTEDWLLTNMIKSLINQGYWSL